MLASSAVVIPVAAGKGGVGKTQIAANLASKYRQEALRLWPRSIGTREERLNAIVDPTTKTPTP